MNEMKTSKDNGRTDGAGQPNAELLETAYGELRRLAAQKLAHERPGQTLEPTALVHEAWLRMAGQPEGAFRNRAHFFAAAAEAMRRILVENARRKLRIRHGGGQHRVEFDVARIPAQMPDDQLLFVDETIDRLAELHPRAAQVVKLCYFVGMNHGEAAAALEISTRTVERELTFARAWLFREIGQREADL